MKTTQKLPEQLYIKNYHGRKQDKTWYVIELATDNFENFFSSLRYLKCNLKDLPQILENTFGKSKFRLYTTYYRGSTLVKLERWDIQSFDDVKELYYSEPEGYWID